ncbi:MAG: VOC family protein [Acidimicrobiia bacterium]
MVSKPSLTGHVRVQCHTDDLEAARKFYEDTMGLELVEVFDPNHCMMLHLTEDTYIEIVHTPELAGNAEMAVQVKSMDDAYRQFGPAADGDPTTTEWGDRHLLCTDPAGNRITFFEKVE